MQNSHRQLIFGLIAGFTLLQLIILGVFGYTPYPDSNGYILLAKESVALEEPYPVSSMLTKYPFLWNIGAINAAAVSIALFNSVVPLLVVYSLMKGITAWMFYAIIKKICNTRIALIALILYIIYPANYGEGTSTLSELPFMFFVMLGIYLSIVRNFSLISGMMFAVANWFRPMAIIFLLALMIFYLYKWRKSIKLILGYTIMIIVIGSCCYLRTGQFLYQAKTGWMALIDYSSGESKESQLIRSRSDLNFSQKDDAWKSLFFDWLKENPNLYVAQIPKKFINTYLSDNVNMCTFIPDKDEKKYMYEDISMPILIHSFPKYSAVQWFTLLNLIIYYLFLIFSIFSLRYFKWTEYALPIGIILLGTLLLLFVGHGEARFHIPFMPFFIMLSSLFVYKIIWKE